VLEEIGKVLEGIVKVAEGVPPSKG